MIRREVVFTHTFQKAYRRSGVKIQNAFDKRLVLFLHDPFSALLKNHSLIGEYIGLRSINITGDWRAIYSEDMSMSIVVTTFHLLGTHSQLYK